MDTIIEISVIDISVVGSSSINRPFGLIINGRCCLIRQKDNKILDVFYPNFYFNPKEYSDWSENDYEILREALNQAYKFIAESAVANSPDSIQSANVTLECLTG